MTRKDYIRLADAFKFVRENDNNIDGNTWYKCVSAIADALQDDNKRFIRQRFMDYCNNRTKE